MKKMKIDHSGFVIVGGSSLTELVAPNAYYVYAKGCKNLKKVDAPKASTVDVDGCENLTEIIAPNATFIYVNGCTSLARLMSGDRLVSLLTGGGKSVAEVAEHWHCHSWENCPMHAAFGAHCIADIPEKFRAEAVLFIALFDHKLLPYPIADGDVNQ